MDEQAWIALIIGTHHQPSTVASPNLRAALESRVSETQLADMTERAATFPDIPLEEQREIEQALRFPEGTASEVQQALVEECIEAVTRLFFRVAERGETFGDVGRVRERFGKTLEENYGLSTGPFMDLARAYWTYTLEFADLQPSATQMVFYHVIKTVETNIRSYSFRHPAKTRFRWNIASI